MLPPDTLLHNRYRVVRQLGHGGMGAVYQATDQHFGRTVAVKESFFASSENGRAFEREAKLLASFRHPSLVTIFATGVFHAAVGGIDCE